ncbi:integrase arm-type DNA-binding domain-containing protein [uncultured Dechloromonas sp.]|uniref:tyrosine-type recombinase/integrase n=1 Tax=uncultured Dechloromonas sp. TaxID=171719 RepID=UPI0025DCA9F3|nr:integrase arm-type DNA-binding domain-containing protein [uncultured Dechloromonas sp.]
MALTDLSVRTAKPSEKARKLADEKGMYLLIQSSGAKLWRMDYRFDSKRKTLALGTYPETSLAQAREKRDEARKLLAQDIDPSAQRKQDKAERRDAQANTFEAIARDWMKVRGKEWSETYAGKTKACLERHAFPVIGSKPIKSINAPELLAMLRAIEKRGTVDMAHRIQQHCGAVFRYAISTGLAEVDPTPSLHGALSTVKAKHYPALTDPKDFAELLRSIDEYRGEVTTKIAMLMLAYTFQRTKEIRFAEWSQFDFDAALWRIPKEVMKMREAHIVPLSKQVIEHLKELHCLTGTGRLLFPSMANRDRPISENTVTYALARMGFKGQMTGHGFRSVASTILNEQGYRHDVIERQLAHSEQNQVRAAYNRAEYLPERKKMMKEWADYLDKLKAGAQIVKFAGNAA